MKLEHFILVTQHIKSAFSIANKTCTEGTEFHDEERDQAASLA